MLETGMIPLFPDTTRAGAKKQKLRAHQITILTKMLMIGH